MKQTECKCHPGRGMGQYHRDYHFKRQYGLTPQDVLDMNEAQGGRCLLCDRAVRLVVDHDHETGRVRGLLCMRCNTGLGKLNDPELLRRAASYLEG